MRSTNSDVLIVKHRHERFTMIARSITEGRTGLSLRATGLLCHLLGKPDSWKTWSRALSHHWLCSRTVILAILKELQEAGYAKLEFKRDNEGRLHGKFWRISDMPEFKADGGQVTEKALKAASGTDGLLSRSSEKSEHRKSSPILNTDFWTDQIRNKENGGTLPPAPASSCSPLTRLPEPQPANSNNSAHAKAERSLAALALAYQGRTGMIYTEKRMQLDLPKARACFSEGSSIGTKAIVKLYNSAWFLTDGYRPVCRKADGSPRFEPFFHCFKARSNPGYLYEHWQQVLEELQSEAAQRRQRRLEAEEGAPNYETI